MQKLQDKKNRLNQISIFRGQLPWFLFWSSNILEKRFGKMNFIVL